MNVIWNPLLLPTEIKLLSIIEVYSPLFPVLTFVSLVMFRPTRPHIFSTIKPMIPNNRAAIIFSKPDSDELDYTASVCWKNVLRWIHMLPMSNKNWSMYLWTYM